MPARSHIDRLNIGYIIDWEDHFCWLGKAVYSSGGNLCLLSTCLVCLTVCKILLLSDVSSVIADNFLCARLLCAQSKPAGFIEISTLNTLQICISLDCRVKHIGLVSKFSSFTHGVWSHFARKFSSLCCALTRISLCKSDMSLINIVKQSWDLHNIPLPCTLTKLVPDSYIFIARHPVLISQVCISALNLTSCSDSDKVDQNYCCLRCWVFAFRASALQKIAAGRYWSGGYVSVFPDRAVANSATSSFFFLVDSGHLNCYISASFYLCRLISYWTVIEIHCQRLRMIDFHEDNSHPVWKLNLLRFGASSGSTSSSNAGFTFRIKSKFKVKLHCEIFSIRV